jgi:hypothetical protein
MPRRRPRPNVCHSSFLDVDLVLTATNSVAFRSVALAALTLLVYDHALTLGPEIARLWTRPSGATILFFANRYSALPAQAPIAAQLWCDPLKTPTRCAALQTYHAAYVVFAQFLVTGECYSYRLVGVYSLQLRQLFSSHEHMPFMVVPVGLLCCSASLHLPCWALALCVIPLLPKLCMADRQLDSGLTPTRR